MNKNLLYQLSEEAMPPMVEYYLKYQSGELCQDRTLVPCSTDAQRLINRIKKNKKWFLDMLFDKKGITGKFMAVQEKTNKGRWCKEFMDRPDQLTYFDYNFFVYDIEDLGPDFLGRFSPLEYKLTIAPKCIKRGKIRDDVILHEMIHLHEAVLDVLPTYYREAVLYCLYRDLSSNIDDLDDRIEAHGHMLNETVLSNFGGRHDILFLLKSFDLDLHMNYPLGTVFGYGMANEIKKKSGE